MYPGWKIRETLIEGDNSGIFATALTSSKNDITIMILNDGYEPASLFLKLELPAAHSILHHMSVSGPMPLGIDKHDNIRIVRQAIRIKLPSRSITTLTSLPAGDLTLPMRLSLKR